MDTNTTEGVTLKGIPAQLDAGMGYKNCTFINCALIITGGGQMRLEGNTFDAACKWNFVGPAGNALNCLKLMYAGGQKEVVEQIFQSIRSGALQQAQTPGTPTVPPGVIQ